MILAIGNVMNYWTLIESFNLAIEINMNVGILTCLLVVKTGITALLFFVLFNQKLNWNDIVGIVILMLSCIFIWLKIDVTCIFNSDYSCSYETNSSKSDLTRMTESTEFWIRLSSVMLMIATVSLFIVKNIIIK